MAAFVNCELIEQEIENEFNQILLRLKFNEYRDAIENSLKINTDKQSDAIKSETDTEEKRKYKMLGHVTLVLYPIQTSSYLHDLQFSAL